MKIKDAIKRANGHVGQVFRCVPGPRGYGYTETDLQGRTWAAVPRGYYIDAKRSRAVRVAGYALHYLGYGDVEDSHEQAYLYGLSRVRDIVQIATKQEESR